MLDLSKIAAVLRDKAKRPITALRCKACGESCGVSFICPACLLAAAEALEAAARLSAWQPIETAPKDGTEVLAVQGNLLYIGCCWGDDEPWMMSNTDCFGFNPTHWQPLPSLPAAAALASGEGA